MIRLSEEAVGVKAAGTWTADARAGGGGRHARLRCSPVRSHRSCRLSRCASEVVVRRELWCVLCGVREARWGSCARRPTAGSHMHVYCTTLNGNSTTAAAAPGEPRRCRCVGSGSVGARASRCEKRKERFMLQHGRD